jgi:hypothetical protein
MNPIHLAKFSRLLAIVFGISGLDLEEKNEIRKTLRFSDLSKSKQLEVDNLNGAIHVDGYNGSEVQLLARETVRARSQQKLQEAREKVRLEITEEGNTIKLYVDGPFRCRSAELTSKRDGSTNYRGDRYYGYSVTYDFELKVPYATGLYLRTVNDGDIKIANVSGDYDVENINGGIEMKEVAGAGRVYALNGEVKVLFDKNPQAESYFGSLNGDIDVIFRPGLSADLRLKTFNGEVYTDFPVTYIASATPTRERRKGRYVYKYEHSSTVRLGSGGILIDMDAFNGDIRIMKGEE